jgi:hypothetical protein
MTTATLKAFRDLHEATTTAPRTMTAREMALTGHNLNRAGDRATLTATGDVYYWINSRQMWVS